MNAIILTIGDELLIGQVVNTNAAFIAARLGDAGIDILRILTVGDERPEIDRGLRESFDAADAVVVTGGLGPTHDDVTKRAVADFFGLPLVHDPALKERIAALLASRGIAWSDAAEEQCLVPAGATILHNRYGTAGGILIERERKTLVALPGVPYEMEQIMTDSVVPLLTAKITGRGHRPPHTPDRRNFRIGARRQAGRPRIAARGREARIPPLALGRPVAA